MTYEKHHAVLVAYLKAKVDCEDWHAVRDAAVDIEILEAAWKAVQSHGAV